MLLSQKWVFCVVLSSLVSVSSRQNSHRGCHLERPEVTGVVLPGEVLIGGVLPVHDDRIYPDTSFTAQPGQVICQRFVFQNYQFLQAMVFAVEEINRNPHLLPNITLGFWIYDSCSALQKALEGTLWLLTQNKMPVPNYQCQRIAQFAGIIGDFSSTHSILMARILGLQRYPQISYFSTSPLLSDRNQFPSFFRTIPSEDFQSRGLAQLVIHFGWTWVGLLSVDNDYGQQGIQILQQELLMAGVCIAFSEKILPHVAHRNALPIIRVIKQSSANVIVVFSNEANVVPLMDEMVKQNVTGKTWVATEAWTTSGVLSMKKYKGILTGTIGFAIHSGEMPGFEKHLNSIHPSKSSEDSLVTVFWEEAFGCKWENKTENFNLWDNTTKLCTGAEKLESLRIGYNDVTTLRAPYAAYSSVYAVAMALMDLQSCQSGRGPFHQVSCTDILDFQPWQVGMTVLSINLCANSMNIYE